jgi:hypothetical protein
MSDFRLVDNWKNITNSQNSVRKKSFRGTFCFSNCHIIGLDGGNLVLIVFVWWHDRVYVYAYRLHVATLDIESENLFLDLSCGVEKWWSSPFFRRYAVTMPTSCWERVDPNLMYNKTVTGFEYPRACRFRKCQFENRSWELPLPAFFKTWFLLHKLWLRPYFSALTVAQLSQQLQLWNFDNKCHTFWMSIVAIWWCCLMK